MSGVVPLDDECVPDRLTDGLNGRMLCHDPKSVQREIIARDGDQPRLRFSTNPPLRTANGAPEAMALCAGPGAGLGRSSAAVRMTEMVANAADLLKSSFRRNYEAVS